MYMRLAAATQRTVTYGRIRTLKSRAMVVLMPPLSVSLDEIDHAIGALRCPITFIEIDPQLDETE